MKNIKIIIVLLMSVTILSCSQDEQAIEEVFDTVTNGAVLRTTAIISGALNVLDPSSLWSIEIEAQDIENGGLLSEVRIYLDFIDNSEGATTAVAEAQIGSIDASDFELGVFGLPRTTITYSLAELSSTFGAVRGTGDGDYVCGDQFLVRLELELTDGRTFTSNQSSGTVSQSFFNSPFQYAPSIISLLPDASAFSGTYDLSTTVSGIYGVDDYASGIYEVESVSNTTKLMKDVTTFPAFGGFGPVDVEFQLICGEIVLTTGQSVGAGCNATINSGPADVNSTYDIDNPDDSDFLIAFTSDEAGDCTPAVQAEIRMVKQ